MDGVTIKSLDQLSRRMKHHPPILFTGAGFSYGSRNAAGRDLPLGTGLKKNLQLCPETNPKYQKITFFCLYD